MADGHPRRRRGLWVFFLLLIAFAFFGQGIALYTDLLWFQEVGYPGVFWTILTIRGSMTLLVALGLFVVFYANCLVASRAAPPDVFWELEDRSGLPSRLVIEPFFRRLLAPALLVFSFFLGLNAGAGWESYVQFANALPFGTADPLFGNDVGFYIFRLPFWRFLYRQAMLSLFLSLLLTGMVYFLHRGIVLTARGPVVAAPARSHLLILVACLLAVKAVGFYLDGYDLLLSPAGVVFGAGYADVYASLPALRTLSVLTLAAALLCAIQTVRRGWRPVVVVLVALGLVWVGGLMIYPTLVQRLKVTPNEIAAERPFIIHNIRMTRQAYGLDRVDERDFPALETLRAEDLARNAPTIENIRLWDHRPLLQTFAQIQEIRTYYKFRDVDNDRYLVNKEYRQVMLSPRELSYPNLPGGRTWINEHMVYTHGYGAVMGPVNRISPEGLPELFIKDIPPVWTTDVKVSRPEIYYGELGNDYVLVRTKRPELDYPSGADNVYTTYAGRGGVPINSLSRRLLFSARFGTLNIVLNADLTPESRIMYYRVIKDRVEKIAPFLKLDQDPYLVIAQDGRLHWLIDAYTTTQNYPYSEPVRGLGNYIRNSVKVTVDTYDGSVTFYQADPEDPILRVYSRAFPGLFKRLEAMPADLRAHIRYPAGMFAIQARLFATYHMRDPQVFYNKEDLWSVPRRSVDGREQDMEPYYTIMRLPGEAKEEFVLLMLFTPSRKDNMIAWMAAGSDPPNYGRLVAYNFPKAKLVYGPRQIEARIDQDAFISQQLSLWQQRGSAVIRGSLLAIPIEQSLLYVEPLYLAAEKGSLPELKRVIVAFGNQIAMEETLDASLQRIFGGKRGRETQPRVTTTTLEGPESSIKGLADQAWEQWGRAQEALRRGDWNGYGDALKRLDGLLREIREKTRR